MKDIRVLGNAIRTKLRSSGVSRSSLCEALDCSPLELDLLCSGRSMCSFKQLAALAEVFKTPANELLSPSVSDYDESIVHCMDRFKNGENREKVLDIIYDYLDVYDAVATSCK